MEKDKNAFYYMNIEQVKLLSLIKKSQFSLCEDIRFNGVDLNALYDEAVFQAVIGLISYEIDNDNLNEKWIESRHRQMASYICYCHAEDEIQNVLCSASIPFVILKGNAAAIYYSNPSYRNMGDIDLLVLPEHFITAKELLVNSGYIMMTDNGRHVSFVKDNIIFELHHHFSHYIDIESYLLEAITKPVVGSIEGHKFPMLPDLANGLVLLLHLRNHLRNSIGLRQVIDWMMYVYRVLDDEFWELSFKPVVVEKKMDKLAITVTRMCQIYLGLPETIDWCKSADIDLCNQLMECILVSGNFGIKQGYGSSVETVSVNFRRHGIFSWLQQAGEHNWKAYHNHHWLKPFCWFYQIFRYAKQGFSSGRNKKLLKSDLDRSKERYELLKQLGIN